MRKLTLNLEALEVQSFLTTGEQSLAPGTVDAYDSGRTPTLTRLVMTCCASPTSPETCDDYTCVDNTCAGFTCVGDSCDYTCHTNICACEISDFGSCIC